MRGHLMHVSKNIKKYVIRGILIVALFFALSQISVFSRPLEYAAVFVAESIWTVGASVEKKIGSVQIFFANKKRIVAENETLQNALRIAVAQTHLYEAVRQENEILKKMLGRGQGAGGTLGVVLSHPNQSPYDTIFIDVGKEHGVRVGALVIFEDVLLGVVDTAHARSSKVRMFSSPGTETNVVVGSKRIPALARGLGGGMFEIKITRETGIAEGDFILYPSVEQYLLGVILNIESRPEDSFLTIQFRAPINIFTVPFVKITNNVLISIEEQE